MTIVEISEYSMVVMKDSEDPPWVSLGNMTHNAEGMLVKSADNDTSVETDNFAFTGRMLVLFFKDSISGKFKEKQKVTIKAFFKV